MPGQTAAKQRKSCVTKCEMQAAANQVVDKNGDARYPQRLAGESLQRLAIEVMGQQITRHHIEGPVAKRKLQRITYYGLSSILRQVRRDAVEQSDT